MAPFELDKDTSGLTNAQAIRKEALEAAIYYAEEDTTIQDILSIATQFETYIRSGS